MHPDRGIEPGEGRKGGGEEEGKRREREKGKVRASGRDAKGREGRTFRAASGHLAGGNLLKVVWITHCSFRASL